MTEAERIAAAYGNPIQGGNPVIQGSSPYIQGGSPTLQPAAAPAGPRTSTPVVTPSPNPSSLKDTMTTPSYTPTPNPAVGNAPEKPPVYPSTTTPTPATPSTPATPPGPAAPNSAQFANYLTTMQDKLKANNVLADTRAKLITALYDHPLTPEEASTLPPTIQKALQSGDKRDLELQIRLINDQIQGRTSSLDNSVNFLSNEYDKSLADAEKQKQDAIQNVLSFVDKYGSNAGQALTSLYGPDYLDKLKGFGIDINNLAGLSTLDQQKAGLTGTLNLGDTQGDMLGLPTYDTASQYPGVSRPNRNYNPGNIKASAATVKYPGVIGIESRPAADGGNFLIFDSPQSGINAIGYLLQHGGSYQGVTAEQAIKKYNGGGSYGAASVGLDPNKDFQSQISNPTVLSKVAQAIAQREGFNPSALPQNNAASQDVATQAQALVTGTLPPSLLTYTARSKAIAAALKLDPKFDAGKAELAYQSAKKFASSMNSSQMIRFNGLAGSVVNTIDEVKDLADKMNLSGIGAYNQAKLYTIVQTQGNTPVGQLASQYLAAVNTLKEEFANLANGGYAPTEAAWQLANSQINGNYGVDQLKASLVEVQRLINYRMQAINGQTPNLAAAGAPVNQPTISGSGSNPLGLQGF